MRVRDIFYCICSGMFQALEKQLSEIEPVFETVVSEGASLTRLVPGEGAENISQVLTKTQKQFVQISDQIHKKVEKQKAAHEMKMEVCYLIYLSYWAIDIYINNFV